MLFYTDTANLMAAFNGNKFIWSDLQNKWLPFFDGTRMWAWSQYHGLDRSWINKDIVNRLVVEYAT